MKIKPERDTYLHLCRKVQRIPIFGEAFIPDLIPAELYSRFYSQCEDTFLFESGSGPENTARYSFMGRSNKRFIEIKNGQGNFCDDESGDIKSHPPFFCLDRMRFDDNEASAIDYIPHFWGGWVGFIGYEMGHLFEKLTINRRNDLDLPDMYFVQVDRLFAYDHKIGVLKYIVSAQPKGNPNHYDRCVAEIREIWKRCKNLAMDTAGDSHIGSASKAKGRTSPIKFKTSVSQSEYVSMVVQAKRYIEAGDIYQANLAQRFETDFTDDSFDLYQRLRKINPSPFSGYLRFRDFAIISSSPERLLKMEGDLLETRPIAGTRPRGATSTQDEHFSTELLLNEKERAEHLMLVDLERNDLGRICHYGTVQVTDFMFLEKYSHVIHIVSNIAGRLKPGVFIADILKAIFPGGTITGCPKIRCMEIIDELEPIYRGPYAGSFGYIGFSHHMDFNIIIRTILVKDRKAYFHVGAGIVADSVPEKEYQETLDKAAAMIQALSL